MARWASNHNTQQAGTVVSYALTCASPVRQELAALQDLHLTGVCQTARCADSYHRTPRKTGPRSKYIQHGLLIVCYPSIALAVSSRLLFQSAGWHMFALLASKPLETWCCTLVDWTGGCTAY